jgi:hypothetical protein
LYVVVLLTSLTHGLQAALDRELQRLRENITALHEQVRQARSVGSQQADKGEQEAAAARGSVHGEGALKAATSKGRKGHKHQGRKSRQ